MHVREYIDTDDRFRVAHNGVVDTQDLGMRVGIRRVGCNHYHSKHGMEMTWTAMRWYLGIDVPETDEQEWRFQAKVKSRPPSTIP